MNGLIIYNGTLLYEKTFKLILRLQEEGNNLGFNMKIVKNNDIIAYFDKDSKPLVNFLDPVDPIDFIIFYDKDILLARHFESMGYNVFNSSHAIEFCDNKAKMISILANNNIKIPKTILGPFVFTENKLSDTYIDSVLKTIGIPFVLKECYGSFGMQVYLIHSKEEFSDKLKYLKNIPFIMQEYIYTSTGRDIRVNIVGNKVIGSMERKNNNDFRANITLNGIGTPIKITAQQEKLALKVHNLLKLDFSGIDILYGENDEPIFCEANSNVNFQSFEKASGVNFAKEIFQHIGETIK